MVKMENFQMFIIFLIFLSHIYTFKPKTQKRTIYLKFLDYVKLVDSI